MIASVPTLELNDDLWAAPKENDALTLAHLQVRDFTRWVRKQIRHYGRRADIGTTRVSAVDLWLRELGHQVTFLSGGELELESGEVITTHWTGLGYYLFNDEGQLVTKAGEWLTIAEESEQQDTYLL